MTLKVEDKGDLEMIDVVTHTEDGQKTFHAEKGFPLTEDQPPSLAPSHAQVKNGLKTFHLSETIESSLTQLPAKNSPCCRNVSDTIEEKTDRNSLTMTVMAPDTNESNVIKNNESQRNPDSGLLSPSTISSSASPPLSPTQKTSVLSFTSPPPSPPSSSSSSSSSSFTSSSPSPTLSSATPPSGNQFKSSTTKFTIDEILKPSFGRCQQKERRVLQKLVPSINQPLVTRRSLVTNSYKSSSAYHPYLKALDFGLYPYFQTWLRSEDLSINCSSYRNDEILRRNLDHGYQAYDYGIIYNANVVINNNSSSNNNNNNNSIDNKNYSNNVDIKRSCNYVSSKNTSPLCYTSKKKTTTQQQIRSDNSILEIADRLRRTTSGTGIAQEETANVTTKEIPTTSSQRVDRSESGTTKFPSQQDRSSLKDTENRDKHSSSGLKSSNSSVVAVKKEAADATGKLGQEAEKKASEGLRSCEAGRTEAKQLAWPAWVYCTRYSDRPSSGPRYRKPRKKSPSEADKRPRTAFSTCQLQRLRQEFDTCQYLSESRRQALAAELGLNESQVKIWFQNKRAKLKKSSSCRNVLAMKLMEEGLYNHSTVVVGDETD